MAHAGERILTTAQTQKFESMVNNSSNQNSSMRIDASSHYSGMNDRQMNTYMQNNSRSVVRAMRRGARQMGISGT
jgi:hypothetical protein